MSELKTQGTQLYVVSGPTAATKIANVTNVSGLGGPKSQIPTTNLESEEEESTAGLGAPGQVTLNINFDPQDASHDLLQTLKESGDKVSWFIGASDGTAAPTVVGSAFEALATRSNWVFTAYVADFNLDFALNEIVRGTVSLQRSGPYSFTKKA